MTGAAAISSAPAASPATPAAKRSDLPSGDAARPDAGEFAAFSELFSYLENEEDMTSDSAPDEDKDKSKDIEGDKASLALLAEMTHLQWFGGTGSEPSAGDDADAGDAGVSPRRAAPLIILPAAKQENDVTPRTAPASKATPMDLPEGSLAELSRRPAPPPSPAITPEIDAGAKRGDPLQSQSIQPPQKPLPAVQAMQEPAQLAAPAGKSGPDDLLPADIKASLLALETVLSKGGSPAGNQSMDRGDERQSGARLIKETRISSVQQETHFAPAMMQSPVSQIADRIKEEAHSIASQAAQPLGGDTRPQTGPVRVLHIQLDPPQLGPLTIRLSLKDDSLRLQLETPRYDTAALIQNDKDSLSGLLRSAGYIVDGLNVQVTPTDRSYYLSPVGGGAAGGFGQAAGQQQGWRQPEGRGSGRADSGGPQGQTLTGNANERLAPQAAKPRRGSIYI